MTFEQELYRMRCDRILAKGDAYKERFEQRWAPTCKVKAPKSAAALEKLIVEYIQLKGFEAHKVEVKGTAIDNTKQVTDVLGRRKTIGSVQYIPSGAKKGQADVASTIYGLAVHWEIKFSKSDRQSKDQKLFEQQVKAAGGYYFIVRDTAMFLEKWYRLMDDPRVTLLASME